MAKIRKSYPALPRPIVFISGYLSADAKEELHQHEWGQFTYAASGVLYVMTDSGSYIVPPNRGVWIPKDVRHGADTPSGAEIRSLVFDAEQTEYLPKSCQVLEVSSLLRELILEAADLERQYDWQGNAGRLMRVIRDQIGQMNKVPLYLPLPRDKKLQKITKHLLDCPSDNRNIDEWGDQFGASGRTLSRLFLKETGMSFGTWRQLSRIQIALESLAKGESVTRVALHVGYTSVSAFITMFRKHMGYTPGAKDTT